MQSFTHDHTLPYASIRAQRYFQVIITYVQSSVRTHEHASGTLVRSSVRISVGAYVCSHERQVKHAATDCVRTKYTRAR
eukprot:2421852-Ditylum_brightwellii.AAC.1